MPYASANQSTRPRVSVVVEGHNESRSLGAATDTLEALAGQLFPLDRIEVLLVGGAPEAARWRNWLSERSPFGRVQIVEAEADGYYALKNRGARLAAAEIIAFADSDVRPQPGWLAAAVAAIEGGADVAVGPSLFQSDRLGPDSAPMQVCASLSWGFIASAERPERCGGFLAHNIAFGRATFEAQPWPIDRARTCGARLYHELVAAGRRIALRSDQRVAHAFSWRWWLRNLHFRGGYEAYWLRRLDPAYPNRWIARSGVAEPALSFAWNVLLDVPRWWRYGRLLGLGPVRRVALLPLLLLLSPLARGAEFLGMCAAILAPDAMRRWADAS